MSMIVYAYAYRKNPRGCDIRQFTDPLTPDEYPGEPASVKAQHWASQSTSRTFLPSNCNAPARQVLVVVFPVPPFWLATAMIFAILSLFLLFSLSDYFCSASIS